MGYDNVPQMTAEPHSPKNPAALSPTDFHFSSELFGSLRQQLQEPLPKLCDNQIDQEPGKSAELSDARTTSLDQNGTEGNNSFAWSTPLLRRVRYSADEEIAALTAACGLLNTTVIAAKPDIDSAVRFHARGLVAEVARYGAGYLAGTGYTNGPAAMYGAGTRSGQGTTPRRNTRGLIQALADDTRLMLASCSGYSGHRLS